jgi:hypothetical protein
MKENPSIALDEVAADVVGRWRNFWYSLEDHHGNGGVFYPEGFIFTGPVVYPSEDAAKRGAIDAIRKMESDWVWEYLGAFEVPA